MSNFNTEECKKILSAIGDYTQGEGKPPAIEARYILEKFYIGRPVNELHDMGVLKTILDEMESKGLISHSKEFVPLRDKYTLTDIGLAKYAERQTK